jgi:Ca2+-binding RTX toxin-like protein
VWEGTHLRPLFVALSFVLLLTLASPAGAKRIVGNRGSNTLIATGVRDVVWARAGHDLVSGGASADTIHGEEGNDVLLGDNGNDVIWGGGGNDTILGGSGRDTIHGEWGSDVVDAGGGNDVVLMDTNDGHIDSIDCGPGIDRVVVRPGDRFANCESFRRLRGAPTPAGTLRRLTANADDYSSHPGNTLWNERDYVFALGGNDHIWAWAGADILWGHNGDDQLVGGAGIDWLIGGLGNDQLQNVDLSDDAAGDGLDRLWAGPGLDLLFGRGDSDELIAIDADRVADFVDCGDGNDRAVVRAHDDVQPNCERVQRLPGK